MPLIAGGQVCERSITVTPARRTPAALKEQVDACIATFDR
jgi:hypothetical protein